MYVLRHLSSCYILGIFLCASAIEMHKPARHSVCLHSAYNLVGIKISEQATTLESDKIGNQYSGGHRSPQVEVLTKKVDDLAWEKRLPSMQHHFFL